MKRRLRAIHSGFLLGLGGLLVSVSCGEHGAASSDTPDELNRRSLLVVTVDTLRSDALGCYGNTGGHTPNLDALAADGVVFERSYAPIATTFPSHASMFTGVYPRTHGVRWNGHSLDESWTTLAEVLSDHGYETGGFVSYKELVNRGGLGQGFSDVSDPKRSKWDGSRPGAVTVDMATEWLDSRGRSPFLLWVHLFEPHLPYPATEYSLEQMGDYSGRFADGSTADELTNLPRGWADNSTERNALRALYDGRVREADRQVGRLLDHLRERGLRDQTLVVVLGDHGQLLGERGLVGHGPLLDEEVLRTPFIIDEPGPRLGPARIREIAGVIDLMPTVLELLDVPVPEGLHGRSLVPALRAESEESWPYFAEVRVAGNGRGDGAEGAVGVLRGEYKLVVRSKRATLFDVSEDSLDVSQLSADDHPRVFQELIGLAWRHQRLAQGQPVAHASEYLDEQTLAELKSLGYVK